MLLNRFCMVCAAVLVFELPGRVYAVPPEFGGAGDGKDETPVQVVGLNSPVCSTVESGSTSAALSLKVSVTGAEGSIAVGPPADAIRTYVFWPEGSTSRASMFSGF